MNKLFKRIAILLCIIFVAPAIVGCIPSINILPQASAASVEKAKLYVTKGTVGVQSTPSYLGIENSNSDDGAKYTYSSANKKIATVNTYGEVLGISKGKTKITVKEIYKGVTSVIGTYAVTVINASLGFKVMEVGLNNNSYTAIQERNNKATYTLKPANTAIVKTGEYASVTGLKLGSTTITVTETYNKKTIKIGTFKVNVVNAKLADKEIEVPISDWSYSGVDISCKNSKATYKYKSSDTKIATVGKDGSILGLKRGNATISVTETYNKVTRKLGSLKVNVIGSSIYPDSKSIELGLNISKDIYSAIDMQFMIYNAIYTCESADENVVSCGFKEDEYGTENFFINGAGLGTTELTVYEDYKGVKTKIGTVNVTVKEYPVTEFKFDSIYEDSELGMMSRTYSVGDEAAYYDSLLSFITRSPYICTTPISFVSSDETIATVDDKGMITPISVGTVEITATCGSFTTKMQAVIKPAEEIYE